MCVPFLSEKPKNACLIISCYDRFVLTLVGNLACHHIAISVISDSYYFCDFSVNFAAIVIIFVACCALTFCEVGDIIITFYFSVNTCRRARGLQ